MNDRTEWKIPWEGIRWAVGYIQEFSDPAFKPGVISDVQEGGKDRAVLPVWFYNTALQEFIEGLYRHGLIVVFDWPKWDAGWQLAENPREILQVDVMTCLRLLTMHVRSDRFNDGHLAAVLESGQLVMILQRLKTLLNEAGSGKARQSDP